MRFSYLDSKYKVLLRNPSRFFEKILSTDHLEKNTFLGVFLYWFGLSCNIVINTFFIKWLAKGNMNIESIGFMKLGNVNELINVMQLQLLLSPLTAFFWIHIYASIIHITVKLFSLKADWRNCKIVNYETTLYLICVCQIPKIFSFIPIISQYTVSLWSFILTVKALKRIYNLPIELTLFSTLFAALFFGIIWSKTIFMIEFLLQ